MAGWLRRWRMVPDAAPAAAAAVPAVDAAPDTGEPAAVPIAESPERTRVQVRGRVVRLDVRTRSGWPRLEAELEAELDDGSATVLLVWLGRRRIAGVEPGGTLVAGGMLVRRGGRRVIFNPSYNLEV